MLGMALRMVGFGLPGEGMIGIILGSALAICAICGLYKCSRCRLRDCSCIKRCMRSTGTDPFDDFELTVLVHEATFTSANKNSLRTRVRLTAGNQTVQTDLALKGNYHQTVQIQIEQGTEVVNLEILDSSSSVLAFHKVNLIRDVIQAKKKDLETETIFTMKQKSKKLLNPKIKVTFFNHSEDVEAAHPVAGMFDQHNVSHETKAQLKKIHKLVGDEAPPSLEYGPGSNDESAAPKKKEPEEVELLARACCGPLEKHGAWGTRTKLWAAVRGPPKRKGYVLAFWKNQGDCDMDVKPVEEIDLLRVTSVVPDPGAKRSDVFIVQYVDEKNQRKRINFNRVDRSRDIWVEMLTLLLKTLRDYKDARMKKKMKTVS